MNCRIIDIHTHIYPVALARRAMEVTGHENDDFKKLPIRENLLARMQEAGGGHLREPAGGLETPESGGGEPVREGSGKKKYYPIRGASPGL